MTPRFHNGGSDQWAGTKPVRSDADRQRWHGRLLPMECPDGEPSHFVGTFALGLALFAIFGGLWLIKLLHG